VKVTDLAYRWGLGDQIRSTLGTLRFCKEAGIECIIDLSLHPISSMLAVKKHKYSDVIQANKNSIHALLTHELDPFLQTQFKTSDVAFCYVAWGVDVYSLPSSPREVAAIDELLTPNEMFARYIKDMTCAIPWPTYSILHFRLGDAEVIQEKKDTNYEPIFTIAKNHMSSTDILLSDSATFKEKCPLPLFTFKNPVAHLGFHVDADKIKHTLFEFFLLKNASSIKTYSVYGWSSGFVTIAAYLYKIPLIKIQ
jgi:hypothetical protein